MRWRSTTPRTRSSSCISTWPEFGPDIYGIAAAARHYFKKYRREINAAEGAFLGADASLAAKEPLIVLKTATSRPRGVGTSGACSMTCRYAELITEEQYGE